MRLSATTIDCPDCKAITLAFIDWLKIPVPGSLPPRTILRAGEFFCARCLLKVGDGPVVIRDVTFPELKDVTPADFAIEPVPTMRMHRVNENDLILFPDARPTTVMKGERAMTSMADTSFADFYWTYKKAPMRYMANQLHLNEMSKIVWWETRPAHGHPPGTRMWIDRETSRMTQVRKDGRSTTAYHYEEVDGPTPAPLVVQGRDLVPLYEEGEAS